MKVTEVTYLRRFRLADYEHEEIVLKASLDEDDSAQETLAELKQTALGVHEDKAEEPKEETKPATGKSRGKKKEEEDAEEGEENDEDSSDDSGEEVSDEEDEDEADEEDEQEEADDEEEDQLKAKVKPSAKGTTKGGKKTFKSKATTYDRKNELHKKLMGEVLKSISPKWKQDEKIKARAVKASQSLEGVDFLDSEGSVLESFKAQVKKLMAPPAKK